MNRLHHLKQTLPSNIELARPHNTEFVLVDYGSTDGMREWCLENISDHIDTGFIKYLRTSKPRYWNPSHAKNIAARNATGDVIVNLDADNFIVKGYIEFLYKVFTRDVILESQTRDRNGNAGVHGKIAFWKKHFHQVRGYDETLEGWNWEDRHFLNRLAMLNILITKTDVRYCLSLVHDDSERWINSKNNSRDKSMTNIESTRIKIWRLAKNKNFIANKGRKWGYAKDLVDINLNKVVAL